MHITDVELLTFRYRGTKVHRQYTVRIRLRSTWDNTKNWCKQPFTWVKCVCCACMFVSLRDAIIETFPVYPWKIEYRLYTYSCLPMKRIEKLLFNCSAIRSFVLLQYYTFFKLFTLKRRTNRVSHKSILNYSEDHRYFFHYTFALNLPDGIYISGICWIIDNCYTIYLSYYIYISCRKKRFRQDHRRRTCLKAIWSVLCLPSYMTLRNGGVTSETLFSSHRKWHRRATRSRQFL